MMKGASYIKRASLALNCFKSIFNGSFIYKVAQRPPAASVVLLRLGLGTSMLFVTIRMSNSQGGTLSRYERLARLRLLFWFGVLASK